MEVSLDRRSLLVFATSLLALAAGVSSSAFGFEDYRISSPVVRDNLAVYFVHGNATGAAPLTLDEALATGAAKIYESPQRPVTIENLSDRSVFIQLGTLLKGGLQDQVVAQSMILPPGSGRVPFDIFCVDPFRSVARGDEDPTAFSSTGALFPWRMARLAMLAGNTESKSVDLLRQSGIWWSIDTARSQLSAAVGEALEPAQAVTWNADETRDARPQVLLRARQSSWKTSLPLALENRKLAQLQQPYLDAFSAEQSGDDVIGAVFAINGRVEGAEIYQSHQLFGHMWPNLLRAYATQAIAASDATAEMLPPVSAVIASLAATPEGQARQRAPDSALVVRENDAAIYTETRATDGNWIHRNYVPKLQLNGSLGTPDALVVSILQSGQMDGQPLASLGEKNIVVLQNAAPGEWSATVAPSLEVARDLDPAQWPEWERMEAGRGLARLLLEQSEWRAGNRRHSDAPWTVGLTALSVGLLLVLQRRRAAAAARGIRRGRRALAAAISQAGRLLVALIAATAMAVVGMVAVILRLSMPVAAALASLGQGLRDRAFRRMARPLALLRPSLRPAFVHARR
jgi:hypothetical protein